MTKYLVLLELFRFFKHFNLNRNLNLSCTYLGLKSTNIRLPSRLMIRLLQNIFLLSAFASSHPGFPLDRLNQVGHTFQTLHWLFSVLLFNLFNQVYFLLNFCVSYFWSNSSYHPIRLPMGTPNA